MVPLHRVKLILKIENRNNEFFQLMNDTSDFVYPDFLSSSVYIKERKRSVSND
jgi:hypothetical protein